MRLLLIALLVLVPYITFADSLECWTDSSGITHCRDTSEAGKAFNCWTDSSGVTHCNSGL